jgi:hypothetical protein
MTTEADVTLQPVRALAEDLALEFALVDDWDIHTIDESVELLKRAKRWLEGQGQISSDAIDSLLKRYGRLTEQA